MSDLKFEPALLNTTSHDFDNATLAERVYRQLRNDILSNKYPPDSPLPEEAIATKLNVSRAPVREALRKLAADGLVTLIRRQGAVVSSLSPQEFLDAYQVREALEVLAIRLATPRLTESDLDALEQMNDWMIQCAAQDDIDKFFTVNAAFHALFIDRSGNEKLKELYYPLVNQMRRYYLPSLYLRGGIERSIEEHGEIIQAVKAGDTEKAAQLLYEHIQVPQRILAANQRIELIPFADASHRQ
jgi:DNA-binding GntR family transcriptional regulator